MTGIFRVFFPVILMKYQFHCHYSNSKNIFTFPVPSKEPSGVPPALHPSEHPLPPSIIPVALFKVRFPEFKLGPKGEKKHNQKNPPKSSNTQRKKPHPLIKTYFWPHRFSFPHHLKVFFTVVTAEGFFVCQPDSAQQMGNPSQPHAGNHQLTSSCPAMERKISFSKEELMQVWLSLDTKVSSHRPKVFAVSNLYLAEKYISKNINHRYYVPPISLFHGGYFVLKEIRAIFLQVLMLSTQGKRVFFLHLILINKIRSWFSK